METYKKFNLYFLLGFLFIGLIPPLINYIIDPFYIFHSTFLPKQYYCNERYNKYEFLRNHINKYDSYMMGSSRLGTTEPSAIEKYMPGSRFYNFSVSGATMFDHLENLKFLLRHGANIKNIYLQADIFELLTVYRYPADNDLLRYDSEVLKTNPLSYKFAYLKILPYSNLTGKIKENMGLINNKVREDFEGTGCWYTDQKEAEIAADPLAYIAQEPSFHQSVSRTVTATNHWKENLSDFKQFVKLCQENQITLFFFITPQNHKMLDSIVEDDYLAMLKSFAEIYPFWDFSGYNSITMNDRNYYETSHYRPYIGERIAARIFGKHAIENNDFGQFVTKDTIDSHLDLRRKEFSYHNQTLKGEIFSK